VFLCLPAATCDGGGAAKSKINEFGGKVEKLTWNIFSKEVSSKGTGSWFYIFRVFF